MHTARDFIGLPVINLATGEVIGEVKFLYYSLASRQVTGISLQSDEGSRFVPLEMVDCIGEDAIFLKHACEEVHADPAAPTTVQGLSVYTREGADVGTVEDLVVDPSQGQVLGLNVSGGLWHDLMKGPRFVPLSQASVGKNTVIVDVEAIREDEDSHE